MPRINAVVHGFPLKIPPLAYVFTDASGVFNVVHRGVIVGQFFPPPPVEHGQTVDYYYRDEVVGN